MDEVERREYIRQKLAKSRAEECKFAINESSGCYCELMPIDPKTYKPIDPATFKGHYHEYYRSECMGRPDVFCPCPERYEPQGTVEDELVKIEEAGK